MAWYLYVAVLLSFCFIFNAGLTIGKRYPYVPAFASPQPLMEQHMSIQDIAWQIVARAEKLFPKIEDFEVEVQYRYIFSLPTSPLYVPFPTGVWVASLAGKTQEGRYVPLWETQYTSEKGPVIQGAMCAMLQELQKEKKML